jgi:uncharacterized protein YkwD
VTPAAFKIVAAVLGGLMLSLGLVSAVVVSSVGAAASMCQREAGEGESISPDGVPVGYTVSEPSGEAIADIPPHYLEEYRRAAEEYGLDWAILAAIGKIESGHGEGGKETTCIGSYAGATGPMQFMPATWASFGVDGNGDGTKDVCEYRDSIHGAANYLAQSGAPQDYQSALFAYNHAQWYVDDVLAQADEYRTAAGSGEEGDMASNGSTSTLAALASPLSVFGMSPAYAAQPGMVGDPGENEYSQMEIEALGLINEYRSQNGLPELLLSDTVSVSSARYAHDMAKYDAYRVPAAHITGPSDYYPEGADLTVRMNAEGYFASRYGENIAAGQGSAGEVFGDWRNSPSHNAMMLSPDMSAVGIGLVENPQTSYGEFWVTGFGSDTDETSRPVPEAGSGGSEMPIAEGDARAVFPLPEEYFDSYEDTWGASRGAGAVHEGTDLFAPDGTPIFSITAGVVTQSDWNYLGGWISMIEATESVGPIQKGNQLYYAHQLEPSSMQVGQEVEAGEQIGKVGSTGEGSPGTLLQPASRGQHLHLGWYDPSGARAQSSSGAINPYPLLEWLRDNGGAASGPSTFVPSAGGGDLPAYCLAFRGFGPLGGVADRVGEFFGGSDGGGGASVPLESSEVGDLLGNPNFSASPSAVSDLKSGVVDERIVAVLSRIVRDHSIYVSVFKTGHPYGMTLPSELGGGPNSHGSGLAADISMVDGVPVVGQQSSDALLDIGRMLLEIPAEERPDEVIGPPEWTAQLGVSREDGFITDPGFTNSHADHLHIAYSP